jgi:hypothetical protein
MRMMYKFVDFILKDFSLSMTNSINKFPAVENGNDTSRTE